MKPRALDLFCGAGGVTRGLQLAGFQVTGVDIKASPRYVGDAFHQADAMTFPLEGFDFIWASPPCQKFTAMRTMYNAKPHDDLLTPTRERLKRVGAPWVIENVPGAPLARGAFMLCGTMFGLGTKDGRAELRRHRHFESSHFLGLIPHCNHGRMTVGVYGDGNGRDYRRDPIVIGVYGGHGRDRRRVKPQTVGVYGHAGGSSVRDGTQQFTTKERGEAMGIDWMTGDELSQAIPPAYSRYIGEQMMPHVLSRMKERAA